MNLHSSQQLRPEDPFSALRGLNAAKPVQATSRILVPPAVVRARRAVRPAALVDAVRRVDTHTDQVSTARWMAWIAETYTLSDCGLLLGLFGHCYLGVRPSDGRMYVDHRLDMTQEILEHYTAGDPVPPGFEAARPLARSEAYAYIEVYDDGTVIPIYPNGQPG